MRTRTRILTPLAASVLLLGLAACGESGSSGTGGDAAASSSAGIGGRQQDCAPVAGDKLVVLEDDKQLQNADNVIPAVNAKASDDALLAEPERGVGRADHRRARRAQRRRRRRAQERDRRRPGLGRGEHRGRRPAAGAAGASRSAVPNFTESTVLANVYADVLKAAGYDASVQEVGNRELYLKALEAGDIQVFPEYLSTLTEILDGDEARQVASGDVQKTLEALKPLAEKVGLTVGEPVRRGRPERLRRHQGVRRQARRQDPVRAGRGLRQRPRSSVGRPSARPARSASRASRRPTA